jgi:glycosyltransferase involved in cell wall biosynthesis
VRKHAYLHLAWSFGMFRGVLWKAASAPEAEIIRSWFGPRVPVTVAASLSAPSAPGRPGVSSARAADRRPGEIDLLFLSRLGPKKNLLFLLDALRRTRASIHLGIAGPIADPAYWRRCEKELGRLPANVRVTLHGALHPDDVASLLETYDVFALPTLDENYGYVILEALAAGCFLLLSPHTPWSDVEREGVGRVLDVVDPALWSAEIDALAGWPDVEFERRRGLAADYARKRLSSDEPLRQLERLLNDASSGQAPSGRPRDEFSA